jgi:UDP-glucose 6-dehydrogenase|nr:MAG TPA: deoxyribosyltransferase [Caudoviricetes sp.]
MKGRNKMNLMISQPMKGKTNEQIREERANLIKKLEEQGNKVVDTVFENAPANEDIAIYMLSQSIRYIGKVDGVVFMKDWEKARGCKIEHQVAVEYGKKVFYEN